MAQSSINSSKSHTGSKSPDEPTYVVVPSPGLPGTMLSTSDKSEGKGGYFDVSPPKSLDNAPKGPEVDGKSQPSIRTLRPTFALTKSMGRAGRSKLGNIRCVLNSSLAVTNSAAQINASVYTVDPLNSPEFASIALIYDEVRVKRFKFRHSCSSVNTLSATTGGNHGGVVSIDFTKLSPASGFGDSFDNNYHYPYETACFYSGIGVTKLATNVSSPGWIDIPSGGQATSNPSGVAILFIGSSWTSISFATTALCAAIRYYELNGHNSGATVGLLEVWMDCEFRCRD